MWFRGWEAVKISSHITFQNFHDSVYSSGVPPFCICQLLCVFMLLGHLSTSRTIGLISIPFLGHFLHSYKFHTPTLLRALIPWIESPWVTTLSLHVFFPHTCFSLSVLFTVVRVLHSFVRVRRAFDVGSDAWPSTLICPDFPWSLLVQLVVYHRWPFTVLPLFSSLVVTSIRFTFYPCLDQCSYITTDQGQFFLSPFFCQV